jgi:O-acetylhomoserine (thiol)-lyase
MFTEPDPSYHGLIYTKHYGDKAFTDACAVCSSAPWARCFHLQRIPADAGHRDGGAACRAARGERAARCGIPAGGCARRLGELRRFPDNPYYPLCQKYLGGRACSLLTFAIRGGYDAGTRFYDALKLFKRLVNLGDAKSLACHPASTTHRQMSVEEQRQAGIGPETIRLSVGIEHIDDIIADLDQALAAATRPKMRQAATT